MEVYANVLIIPLRAAMVIDLASYRGSRVSGLNVSLCECGLFMEKKQNNLLLRNEEKKKQLQSSVLTNDILHIYIVDEFINTFLQILQNTNETKVCILQRFFGEKIRKTHSSCETNASLG